MSKQVTMTMYAHKADQWDDVPYALFMADMSQHRCVCLGEVEVTFTPPRPTRWKPSWLLSTKQCRQ